MSYGYNSNIPLWFAIHAHPPNALPDPAHTVLVFEVSGDKVQTLSGYLFAPDEGASQGATMFSAAGDGTASGLHSKMRGADHIHYATGDLGGRPRGTAGDQFGGEGRHSGGSNFLLADGHVKWMKPNQVSGGTDAPTPTAAQTGGLSGTAAGTANRAFAATFSAK